MTAVVMRHDARDLPLPDGSVDLICTSPPYYAQRSYTDGGVHYAGQIGDEPTPGEYINNLLACTAEWARVLKPGGSMFVNLGDKYSDRANGRHAVEDTWRADRAGARPPQPSTTSMAPPKSRLLLPERYRIGCVDQLGLIARAVIIWSKANGLPESVTDRVRSSHEDWVHLTKQPRYYAAVDRIRQPYEPDYADRKRRYGNNSSVTSDWAPSTRNDKNDKGSMGFGGDKLNPLGALPGSVWEIATEPLVVPDRVAHAACCGGIKRDGCEDGLDHYACVDDETEILTRRGWLRHEQVSIGEEVAGYDLDTGVTSWTRCHGVHRYNYDGELVVAEAHGMSMRLTPNHRTLAHRHAGAHKVRQPMEVIRADELTRGHSIPRAVTWADDGREKSVGEDFAALCGWVAAEGWVTPSGRVYLCQSVTANPRHVATIDRLLSRVDVPQADRTARVKYRRSLDLMRRTVKVRQWRGRPSEVVTWALPLGLSQQALRTMPGKVLPTSFGDLPSNEAAALLDAFVCADGHTRTDGRRSIFQKDRRNLDVLQAVAVRCGYNTTLRESGGRWVLYINPPRPARLRRADGTSLVRREHYSGIVWCVTTGTGTFVARRRGSVFVTGNSYPTEWPRRIILGWSPSGVCTACGEGRRPVAATDLGTKERNTPAYGAGNHGTGRSTLGSRGPSARIRGEVCACTPYTDHPGTGKPHRSTNGTSGGNAGTNLTSASRPSDLDHGTPVGPWREYHLDRWAPAPTTPAIVLDPFGGTGTTALVAHVLGRVGISNDRSLDYCRLAQWRTTDPDQIAKAMRVPKPPKQTVGQADLFGDPTLWEDIA